MWQGEQSWNFKPDREPCRYLWNGFNILTNGDITPCCVAPNPVVLGNAFATPLKDIWNGKEYQQIVNSPQQAVLGFIHHKDEDIGCDDVNSAVILRSRRLQHCRIGVKQNEKDGENIKNHFFDSV